MNDEVYRSGQLVSSGAVVERGGVVRMVETQLGPERNNLIRPPRDTDGVFRIGSRMAGAASNDIVVELISNGKKRSRRNAKHRVIDNPPFGRVTRFHRK